MSEGQKNKISSGAINDPDEYLLVSKKHWSRKQNIQNGSNQLGGIIGRPGPITGIVMTIVEGLVVLIIKFVVFIFSITTYSFEWVNNMTFGNFKGILPTSLGKGKVISMKFFRYTMTVLMPPMGVFLNKGMYGWFNVLVCAILTYINFIAGIIYAFVITSRNRYADQYEEYIISESLKNNPQDQPEADYMAFLTLVGFISLIGLVIFLFIRIF
jgi:uncharacterized membrane protein YqaE (UPF0057 family)